MARKNENITTMLIPVAQIKFLLHLPAERSVTMTSDYFVRTRDAAMTQQPKFMLCMHYHEFTSNRIFRNNSWL
jgi:hypothetical protein